MKSHYTPIIFLAGILLFPFSQKIIATPDSDLPNVIFILADDLGYGDLSCNGQTRFQTPNIDALAASGISFTQHYSGSTVCAPSRCSLLTGFHTGHSAVRGNQEYKPEGQFPMPPDTYTVGHLFQKAGYKTGVFGKWGLGHPDSASEPLKMGFDRFYGYNCQRIAHSYYPAFLWNDNKREFLWGNVGSFSKDYAPDFIHKEALHFIQQNKSNPFFLYYAAIQPHADMDAPEAYMNKHRGKYLPENDHPEGHYKKQPEGHAAFAAMTNILDDYVGDIVAVLNELGIADNTLIIFTSDNGPHLEGGHDPEYWNSNGPFRGFKRDLYEGGIRVPFLAVWPNKIKAGSKSEHISAFWDFLPTISEITGIPLKTKTDGISYLSALTGNGIQREHDYLYWEFSPKGGRKAIRLGKWKAVQYNIHNHPEAPIQLFDLSSDPGEQIDLAKRYPEIVAKMKTIFATARTDSSNPKFNFSN